MKKIKLQELKSCLVLSTYIKMKQLSKKLDYQ